MIKVIIRKIQYVHRKLWYNKLICKGVFGQGTFGSGIPKLSFVEGGLKIGTNVRFNPDVFINARGGVNIGNNCSLSKGVRILASSLVPEKLFYNNFDRTHEGKGISIGSNVWLATNVIILDGVSICDNVVIAAGAVVTKSIHDEFSVYAGNPAKKVKQFDLPSEKASSVSGSLEENEQKISF